MLSSPLSAATSVLGRLRRRGGSECPSSRRSRTVVAAFEPTAASTSGHARGCLDEVSVSPALDEHKPCNHSSRRDSASHSHAHADTTRLPSTGAVVVVSGGGWGAGDLKAPSLPPSPSATRTSSASPAETMQPAGGCADSKAASESWPPSTGTARGGRRARSSTGGVTCLEAWVVGCPTIAYRAPPAMRRACTRSPLRVWPCTRAPAAS